MIKKEIIQVVKQIPLVIVVFLVYSCTSNKLSSENNRNYKIMRYLSDDQGSYITLKTFDDVNRQQKQTVYYRINNIIFPNVGPDKKFNLPIIPGKFKIVVGSIGKKETVVSNLKINKGDSVLIKIYLEDSTELLN